MLNLMELVCPHCGAQNDRPMARVPSIYCAGCGRLFDIAPSRLSSGRGPAPILEWRPQPTGLSPGVTTLLGSAPATQAKIQFSGSDGKKTDFPLRERNTLGRHPSNNIQLNDREISKEHAVIERRGDAWWLRDLGSSNGTFVEGRRISEVRLTSGDRFRCGPMELVFIVEKDTALPDVQDVVRIVRPDGAGHSTHIHARLENDPEMDFRPVVEVTDLEVLRRDYEKLRLTHLLARIGLTLDLDLLFGRTLNVVFEMLAADRGAILLLDEETGKLTPRAVRHRQPQSTNREITISSTILNQVLEEKASVVLSDAFVDPRFSGSDSIIAQGIRSAMCVPLVSGERVLGLMHLDTHQRVGAFTEKDLQLLQSIAIQTAAAIENTRLVRQIEAEARTRDQLNRFLPPHVVEAMVAGKGAPIRKGGREVEASVVFCDIRGFTALAESVGASGVVALLNEYFERLVEVVFRRHGVLDKFIGDALMASWGTLNAEAEESESDSAYDCVAAAVEFRDVIRALNDERRASGEVPIRMGVGVNTGRLVAGYMGSRRRLEYTVIGDTVNTASRLCSLAEGDQVLVAESTYNRVADRVLGRYLGTRQVKGKERELKVYEVIELLETTNSGEGA
jgi:adenylate cyclase